MPQHWVGVALRRGPAKGQKAGAPQRPRHPVFRDVGASGPRDQRRDRQDPLRRPPARLGREAEQVRPQLGDLNLRVYDDNSLSIGRTPLVRLNRVLDGGKATILAKIEGRNPAYSVKCRIGASMVWDAEKRGVLRPGRELVEPTSGNTGIARAFVAAARGYPITLTMPETFSMERRKVLKAFGANLVLTDGTKGMAGSITKAEEMVASDPGRFVLLQQFKNPANPRLHVHTTGPEIWNDTQRAIARL